MATTPENTAPQRVDQLSAADCPSGRINVGEVDAGEGDIQGRLDGQPLSDLQAHWQITMAELGASDLVTIDVQDATWPLSTNHPLHFELIHSTWTLVALETCGGAEPESASDPTPAPGDDSSEG